MDLSKLDLYGILKISDYSTEKQIKKAYKKQALKLHPDKNPNNPKAAEEFQLLQKVFEHLINPTEKNAYDRHLRAEEATVQKKKEMDSKRRKLIDDLENREKEAKKKKEVEDEFQLHERMRKEARQKLEQERFQLECERLRKMKERIASGKKMEQHRQENCGGEECRGENNSRGENSREKQQRQENYLEKQRQENNSQEKHGQENNSREKHGQENNSREKHGQENNSREKHGQENNSREKQRQENSREEKGKEKLLLNEEDGNILEEGYKIKLKWKMSKYGRSVIYSGQALRDIFSKYGHIEELILPPKDGLALIQYSLKSAAIASKEMEEGYPENPIKITLMFRDEGDQFPSRNLNSAAHNLKGAATDYIEIITPARKKTDETTVVDEGSNNNNSVVDNLKGATDYSEIITPARKKIDGATVVDEGSNNNNSVADNLKGEIITPARKKTDEETVDKGNNNNNNSVEHNNNNNNNNYNNLQNYDANNKNYNNNKNNNNNNNNRNNNNGEAFPSKLPNVANSNGRILDPSLVKIFEAINQSNLRDSSSSSSSSRDFESVVMMRMRQAAERQRLIEKLKMEDQE